MFKVSFHEQEDCTVDVTTLDIGRGCWSMVAGDAANYTYTFSGFDDEDRITIFLGPLASGDDWETVMVLQRPATPMVMCRITCVGLDVLAERVNATLAAWENW